MPDNGFLDSAYLLYFVNGLAYFVMGLTISLELRRAQFLRITDKLWLLAAHAFLSSIGNWLEMVFRMPGGAVSLEGQPVVQAVVLGLFVVSCAFLIACWHFVPCASSGRMGGTMKQSQGKR